MEIGNSRIPAAILIEREGSRVRRQWRGRHVMTVEKRREQRSELASFHARRVVATS